MALLTLAEHKAFASLTTNDPARDAALTAMIAEASDAVIRHCNNGSLEATQYTQILDAIPQNSIILPYAPVIYKPNADPAIDFQLYRLDTANGDPSAFTSANLLTIYRDYILDMGPTDVEHSLTGIVRFLNAPIGLNFERPLYSLAVKLVPIRGAIKVVYTAGYETVPASIKMVINLVVRRLFNLRKLGVPLTSESLNGYSYSSQGTATADGIITGDPTISRVLRSFCRPQIGGYY